MFVWKPTTLGQERFSFCKWIMKKKFVLHFHLDFLSHFFVSVLQIKKCYRPSALGFRMFVASGGFAPKSLSIYGQFWPIRGKLKSLYLFNYGGNLRIQPSDAYSHKAFMVELSYRSHRKIVPSYYNSAIIASWASFLPESWIFWSAVMDVRIWAWGADFNRKA